MITPMNGAHDTILQYLSAEIATLMKSGDNWQIVLHGGRHGDVKAEVKRVRQVTTPTRLQGAPVVVEHHE